MFKTLSGFILLTLTFLCCLVANCQVIENDVKLLDLRTDPYGLEVDYLLEARLAQGEEIGGLVAFGVGGSWARRLPGFLFWDRAKDRCF